MPQDRLLAVVVDNQEVALVQAGVQDSCHDRLIVGQELRLLTPRPCCSLASIRHRIASHLLVLLVHDLQKRADIDVMHLADR